MPPPPNPNAKRRNARVGPVLLPAKGRIGQPPAWPLSGRRSATETTLWADLWRLPQAIIWERLGLVRVVARYCRLVLAAEARGALPAYLAQATALEDRLGLSPKAMRTLMWDVPGDEVAEQRAVRAAAPASARGRIRAVG
jgi:hypothetical protein